MPPIIARTVQVHTLILIGKELITWWQVIICEDAPGVEARQLPALQRGPCFHLEHLEVKSEAPSGLCVSPAPSIPFPNCCSHSYPKY